MRSWLGDWFPRGRVISDTKNLLYYFRLSPDGRMVFGGRAIVHPDRAPGEAPAILAAGMREVFPRTGRGRWNMPGPARWRIPWITCPTPDGSDGVHYAMGYCGHGVALATYLGTRMGEVLPGTGRCRTWAASVPGDSPL